MRKNLFPSLIVSATIILVTLCVCVFFSSQPTGGNTPTGQMDVETTPDTALGLEALKISRKVEMVDKVGDMILNREVVPDAYFYYLEDSKDLLDSVKTHNRLTAEWTEYFTQEATRVMIALFELKEQDGSVMSDNAFVFLKMPAEIGELVERICNYSLYRNCTELILSDTKLARVISGELGGSYGMWPHFWHTERIQDEDTKVRLAEYLDLEDHLIPQIEEYRSSLIGI